MAQTHDVRLYVGPDALSVAAWDRYDLRLSMLEAGAPWTFSFWRSQVSGSTWSEVTSLKAGHLATASIDGTTILTGYVEDRWRHGARDGGAALVLAGRDMAAQAMKSDADPTIALRGVALQDALSRLFAGCGLTVDVAVTAQAAVVSAVHAPRARRTAAAQRRAAFDLAHPRVGEKIWQVADRLCRRAGYLLWVAPGVDSGRTSLVVDVPHYDAARAFTFDRVETTTPSGNTTVTGNVLDGGVRTRLHDTPTELTMYGGTLRGDGVPARLRAVLTNPALTDARATGGTVADAAELPPVPRYVHTSWGRTPAECQQEAARFLADCNAHLRQYTCTVQGHGQSGSLYDVNRMATVRDDTAGVSEDMLVTGVQFSGGRKTGQTTTLTLVPINSINLTPTNG